MRTIVSQQNLKNNLIRFADVANAKTVLRPSVAGRKAWSSSKKRPREFPVEKVSMPNEFDWMNKLVVIALNAMFVSRVPIFVTYSKMIKFITVEHLP